MKARNLLYSLVSLITGFDHSAAQCSGAPVVTLDLSSSPSASIVTAALTKSGTCCSLSNCVNFIALLHPKSAGFSFGLQSGAVPPGALTYELNCDGNYLPMGTEVCFAGTSVSITHCKAGGNANTYSLTAIPAPFVTDSIFVRTGCTQSVTANGFSSSSIQWTAINSGSNTAAYNGFLSCTTCSTVSITGQGSPPPFVDYEVSGTGTGVCSSTVFRDTLRVWFYEPLAVTPLNTMICAGNTVTTLSATVTGGKPVLSYTWQPLASNSASVSTSAGNYTLTVNDLTGCPPVITLVSVSQMSSAITASAGPDQTVCKSASVVSLNASGSYGNSFLWSSNATGTFIPSPTAVTASFVPSSTALTSGSVLIWLTSSNSLAACPGGSDTLIVQFQDSPSISATSDLSVCANNPSVAISASLSGFPATLNWTAPSDLLSSFTGTDVIFYAGISSLSSGSTSVNLFTSGNGVCSGDSRTINIYITASPSVFAGPDQVICVPGTALLNGTAGGPVTSVWWTSMASGSFLDNSELSTTYWPNFADQAAGAATLVLNSQNDGNCLAAADTLIIYLNPLPVVSVNSGTICAGQQFTIVPAGALTYTISGGNSVVSPASLNIYTITGMDAAGCTNTALSHIKVFPLPVVVISGQTEICYGGGVTFIGFGANTYTWQPGNIVSFAHYLSGITTTTFSLTGTDVYGCQSVPVTQTLIVTPAATLSANGATVCEGESVTLTVTGATWYIWNNTMAGDTITVSPVETTTLFVWGSGPDVCSGFLNVVVTVNECAGVRERTEGPELLFYPNPSGRFLNFPDPPDGTLIISDGLGKELYRSGSEGIPARLDLLREDIRSGVYFLKFVHAGGQCVFRLVVNE